MQYRLLDKECCKYSTEFTRLRSGIVMVFLGALSACTTSAPLDLPAAPDLPWKPQAGVWDQKSSSNKTVGSVIPNFDGAPRVFSVPEVPGLSFVKNDLAYAQNRTLDLPQLIDIAQRENQETRQAWNRAREAALSTGLTDALFLPLITASVVAGEQRVRVPVNLPFNQSSVDVNNKLRGTTPFLTLTWLLFDFGERNAIREGTQYAALAANILFNSTHQKVIRDVTEAYYRLNAARSNAQLERQSLALHEEVLKAVQVRFDAGFATKVDIALARQALAQGRLGLVNHEGLERTSYLSLMDALGIPSHSVLDISVPVLGNLPSTVEPLTQERIQEVIAQRADIAAAYAAVKVAEAGLRTTDAAFLPKVYVAAGLAHNRSSFDIGSLPGVGARNAVTGALIGISVPLYDGGLRSTQRDKASLAIEQAQVRLTQLQKAAIREIVVAEQALYTALQSHDAAKELVQTARVAHDAALASYRVGRVSTVPVTESVIQLNKAQQALAQAQYASLSASANLAFVMGTMVSAQKDWGPKVEKRADSMYFYKE